MLNNPLEQFDLILIFNLPYNFTFKIAYIIILVICLYLLMIYSKIEKFTDYSKYILVLFFFNYHNFCWFINFSWFTNFSLTLFFTLIIILNMIDMSSIEKNNNLNLGFGLKSKTRFIYFFNFLLDLVKRILKDNLSIQNKNSFFFVFFYLFLIIFVSNLVGMLPYSFTITSHFIFTFFLALSFFIAINIIGIKYHKEKYFVLFLPDGVPVPIIPILILIEYISYFSRVLSLSIRLFANMTSGHILMKILIGFVWSILFYNHIIMKFCFLSNYFAGYFYLGSIISLLSFLPFLIVFFVVGLEFAIAFLQAYVFIVLLSIYLNDVINVH